MRLIVFWNEECWTWCVREDGIPTHDGDLCPGSLTREASDEQVIALVKDTFEIDPQDTIQVER